jgi:hypothetical protein
MASAPIYSELLEKPALGIINDAILEILDKSSFFSIRELAKISPASQLPGFVDTEKDYLGLL